MTATRTLLCAAIMAIGGTPLLANADNGDLIELDPFSVKNFYVGVEGGVTFTDTNEAVIKFDEDTHARVSFGYNMNEWLAAEAAFIDFGSFEAEEVLGVKAGDLANSNIQLEGQPVTYAFEVDAKGYGAGIKLQGTFVADVDVYARFGYYEVTTEVNIDGVGDGDDSGYYYSAGVSYPFTDWLSGSVNWTSYTDFEILNTDYGLGLNTLNIGLQIDF